MVLSDGVMVVIYVTQICVSFVVLSIEELAKAKLLYDAAAPKWSATLGLFGLPVRVSEDVMLPERLTTRRLPHSEKLQAAERFASGFGAFGYVDRREECCFPADPESFCGGRAAAELGQTSRSLRRPRSGIDSVAFEYS